MARTPAAVTHGNCMEHCGKCRRDLAPLVEAWAREVYPRVIQGDGLSTPTPTLPRCAGEGVQRPLSREAGEGWGVGLSPVGAYARPSILPSGRPANRCTWKWGTSWPLCSPMLVSSR
jgi:hypothetical protein